MNYNIGLDIGVASVGWCVTDKNNNILKKNGKNLWGSRIFSEAETAQNRRTYRGARRRIERRKERINMLQSLVKDEMDAEYPNFFPQLRETSLNFEDKKIVKNNYNLFEEQEYNDKGYYRRFPTIYHLREHLIQTDEKIDFRLVYLAIHHIIKYRGNFLYEGDFSNNTNAANEKINNVVSFIGENNDIKLNVGNDELLSILNNKNMSKADKKDKILECFSYDRDNKQVIVNIVNSFLGYSFDINKIFGTEIEKNKVTFASEIENEDEIEIALQEKYDIYESMRAVYSWYILQDILNGNEYISEAMQRKYEKYQVDLKLLKKIYKKYFKDEYNEMFRKEGKNNYTAYNGKKVKKCKPEEFFNTLKNKIKELPEECNVKEKILKEIEDNIFLRKINVTDNGAIPHQLHQKELEIILDKQSKYYNTLAENKEKILKIFSFRIPYYVGPLSKTPEKWSWVVRKSDEKIRPWNFEEVVDENETAEKFIRRMTNKCTYLINEDVMPKNSLLYSRFCVLNELNNIRVCDKKLAKDTKKRIIDNLFKTRKKVTKKMLKDFLRKDSLPNDEITGISDDIAFNANMSSFIDLKNILGKIDEENYKMCEDIIYWITIFEEKSILKRKIKSAYPMLDNDQVNKLCKLKYTGWSRLSKELIVGLKSNDGESILEKLENTPLNFMQIINNKEWGFGEKIEELMPKVDKNIRYSDIDEIPTSPANKRAIWQTICIVKEIEKVMKCAPKNIYIEFARSEEAKIMKDNRAKKLLNIYNEINELKNYDEKVYKQLREHQSDRTISEKLYLYMIQNGKCLYSAKPLDIDNLSYYEVDHIIPQSYIKDDSIDNKALVIRDENQRKKDTLLLEDSIINARIDWWKSLLDNGLMTQNKYAKLTRRKMFETENDKVKFIQRQLVETRQITKYVTNLLKNSNDNIDIFAIRAELTHWFRTKYSIYKNRNVNNFHHAQDAYILNVIGNILDNNLKYKDEFKYNEYVKKYIKEKINSKEKYGMILGLISNNVDIAKVKKVMNYKDCYVTRMLEEGTGEFYNQTLYGPKDKPVIPLKENLIAEKYGGYSNENKAYSVIFEYIDEKGQKQYQLVGIPIKIAYDIKRGIISEKEYIQKNILKELEYSELRVIRNKVLKNQQYIDENNDIMRLCSDKEIRMDKELILDEEMNKLVFIMNKDEMKKEEKEREELEENYKYMIDYLIEKIREEYKAFGNIYTKLLELENKFMMLNEQDKKSTINGIIGLMATGQGNLKAIGLSDREGRMSGKKFDTKKLTNMTFIDKSVTGIYERRFKVNGMENSSSKQKLQVKL